jgi:RNA polymerase sigma factor (TIGR02999 family)
VRSRVGYSRHAAPPRLDASLRDVTPADDIAALLERAEAGDAGAWRRLVDLVYPDLKRLARGARAQPRDATLGTTALVHECWLRLARAAALPRDHDHLLALAVRIMRQVLVDHARERLARKRGGGEALLAIDDVEPRDEREFELLAEIDDALRTLAANAPRRARVFECRYFGGLNDDETARVLGISPRTAHRDWDEARAWLAAALRPA